MYSRLYHQYVTENMLCKYYYCNIIIVVIIINIIIMIIFIIISCLYPMLNKPVKTKQLFLYRPLVCSTVHFLLNWFFGTSQLPIFSLILRFLPQSSVYYLCFVHFFYFHFFVVFQNRALCHKQGLGAYFVSACASNFITDFRTFKEIFNSLTHSPNYITASLTFKAVGEILWCYQSNGTSLEKLLRGAMCRILQKEIWKFCELLRICLHLPI